MNEISQEEALHQAVAPVGRALNETEAGYGAWAVHQRLRGQEVEILSLERRTPRAFRAIRLPLRLMRRFSLFQQALDYRAGERPRTAPLPPPPHRPVVRVRQQIHVRAQRRSSGR